MKIDRSCVAMIKTGQEQLPFFGTVITAAHGLDLLVTAGGIETPAQAKYLMDRGCDSLQGYLFARPAPASELAATMESALNAIDRIEGLRWFRRRPILRLRGLSSHPRSRRDQPSCAATSQSGPITIRRRSPS